MTTMYYTSTLAVNEVIPGCLAGPCNNGTCEDTVLGDFSCTCPPTHTGSTCETGILF